MGKFSTAFALVPSGVAICVIPSSTPLMMVQSSPNEKAYLAYMLECPSKHADSICPVTMSVKASLLAMGERGRRWPFDATLERSRSRRVHQRVRDTSFSNRDTLAPKPMAGVDSVFLQSNGAVSAPYLAKTQNIPTHDAETRLTTFAQRNQNKTKVHLVSATKHNGHKVFTICTDNKLKRTLDNVQSSHTQQLYALVNPDLQLQNALTAACQDLAHDFYQSLQAQPEAILHNEWAGVKFERVTLRQNDKSVTPTPRNSGSVSASKSVEKASTPTVTPAVIADNKVVAKDAKKRRIIEDDDDDGVNNRANFSKPRSSSSDAVAKKAVGAVSITKASKGGLAAMFKAKSIEAKSMRPSAADADTHSGAKPTLPSEVVGSPSKVNTTSPSKTSINQPNSNTTKDSPSVELDGHTEKVMPRRKASMENMASNKLSALESDCAEEGQAHSGGTEGRLNVIAAAKSPDKLSGQASEDYEVHSKGDENNQKSKGDEAATSTPASNSAAPAKSATRTVFVKVHVKEAHTYMDERGYIVSEERLVEKEVEKEVPIHESYEAPMRLGADSDPSKPKPKVRKAACAVEEDAEEPAVEEKKKRGKKAKENPAPVKPQIPKNGGIAAFFSPVAR